MARYIEVIDTPLAPRDAFDYLADFSNCAEWDPSVVEAKKLSSGPLKEGSSFRVVVSFLGRRPELIYEIRAYDPPYRVVLEGGDASIRSIDEISFTPRDGGTRITYEARLLLPGWRSLLDPLLNLVFQRIGHDAVRGLRAKLAGSQEQPKRVS